MKPPTGLRYALRASSTTLRERLWAYGNEAGVADNKAETQPTMALRKGTASSAHAPSLEAPARQDVREGYHLRHYLLGRLLGRGGMSQVFWARDEKLGRDVAIKVLHSFLADSPECQSRLAREAKTVARLEHPHILKVLDFYPVSADSDSFIVVEFVDGQTLRTAVDEHPISRVPELGAVIVDRLASALAHAHSHGVVHRDIKPENIMVRSDGCIKLMDFGIARIADEVSLTLTGSLLGSPAHMAPECIDGQDATPQSDLFALGTVLYWLCTGHLPFVGKTAHALLRQIAECRYVPPQQHNPRISNALARTIERCLAKRPADRFENALALSVALSEALAPAKLVVTDADLAAVLLQGDAVQRFLPRMLDAYVAEAHAALAAGQRTRALALLNRVLADDAAHPEAQALIASMAAADDAHDAPSIAAETPPATAATLAETPPLADVPVVVTPAAAPQPRFLAFARVLLLTLVVAGAVVLFAIVTRTPAAAVTSTEVPFIDERSIGEPAAAATPPTTATDGDPPSKVPTAPVRAPKKTTKAEAVVEASAAKTAWLTVHVHPFADISVDGEILARGQKSARLQVTPGPHTVELTHPRAEPLRQEVQVNSDAVELRLALKPLPAKLVVEANLDDALVQVGAQGAMSVKDTQTRGFPVVVAPAFRATRAVTVYKRGFLIVKRDVEFRAGETNTLSVVLEPVLGPAANTSK